MRENNQLSSFLQNDSCGSFCDRRNCVNSRETEPTSKEAERLVRED